MTLKVLLGTLLALSTAACAMGRRPPAPAADAATEKKSMAIQEWKGAQGGGVQHSHMVVLDDAAWKGVWREVGKDAPPLDFDKFAAVAVFIGQRPTGGWTAVFDQPIARGDDLLIRYKIPKPTGFVTQAFTQPWKFIAFPKPKGRVVVEYYKEQ